jgi:hypothetical protein
MFGAGIILATAEVINCLAPFRGRSTDFFAATCEDFHLEFSAHRNFGALLTVRRVRFHINCVDCRRTQRGVRRGCSTLNSKVRLPHYHHRKVIFVRVCRRSMSSIGPMTDTVGIMSRRSHANCAMRPVRDRSRASRSRCSHWRKPNR